MIHTLLKNNNKKTIFYDNNVNFIPRDVLEVLQRQILTLTLQYEQVSAPGKTNGPFFRFRRNRFFFFVITKYDYWRKVCPALWRSAISCLLTSISAHWWPTDVKLSRWRRLQKMANCCDYNPFLAYNTMPSVVLLENCTSWNHLWN